MMKPLTWLATVVLSWSLLVEAQAQGPLSCGDTLRPSSRPVVMSEDLTCQGNSVAKALTLNGPVTLEMRGHAITCLDQNDGLRLIGSGARVIGPGSIINCNDGIFLQGDGAHVVQSVTISGSDSSLSNAVIVFSDANIIKFNVIKDIDGDGIVLFGASSNRILRNRIARIGGDGVQAAREEATANTLAQNRIVDVDGIGIEASQRSRIASNVIVRTGEEGISIPPAALGTRIVANTVRQTDSHGLHLRSGTSSNVLRSNVIADADGNGIYLERGAGQNQILENTVVRSDGFDLVDENIDCDQNTWSMNTFSTKNSQRSCIR